MDLHLKQWRNQHESEEQQQHQTKIPKLFLDDHHQQQQTTTGGSSALPLFVSDEPNTKLSCNLSDPSSRFPKMGSYFSMAQWQELELQALIYRYMLAGASVPQELLQHIKKSLFQSATPYFLHQHYQPALLQSGYWGRAAMDPEPGRCRRTDGKKWRCSRDVVAGQKYCERHVHRGRNRSRKPVEINPSSQTNNTPTSTSASGGGALIRTTSQTTVVGRPCLGFTGQPPSSIDLHHLNQSPSDSKNGSKGLFCEVRAKSDGHVLRHFFDDWPKSIQDRDNNNNGSSMSSATCLSISMPGNPPSDVALKLSTGNLDEVNGQKEDNSNNANTSEREGMNWAGGWASAQGGPLAEALRSSTNSSCPTSVLHQLPRGSTSEAGYVVT